MNLLSHLLLLLVSSYLYAAGTENILKVSPFGTVTLIKSEQAPRGVILYLTGRQKGWTNVHGDIADSMAASGFWTVIVNTPTYLKSVGSRKSSCFYIAGDLENLSKHVQKKYDFKEYLRPIVVGDDIGATLSYLAYAQAPENTFGGAISLNYCADLTSSKKPCTVGDLKIRSNADKTIYTPASATHPMPNWFAVHGTQDKKCGFSKTKEFVSQIPSAHFVELTGAGHDILKSNEWLTPIKRSIEIISQQETVAKQLPSANIADLPLIETIPDTITSDFFVIFLSGDGGWAGIDKSITAALAKRGTPVIGLNSLKYFWKDKSAETLAGDLGRIISSYSKKLAIKNIKFVGYSFGADVLPFAFNELSGDQKKSTSGIILLGLSQTASFEFHFEDWLHDSNKGLPTIPELKEMIGQPPLCIYGDEETDSACPNAGDAVKSYPVSGGHHLGGDYDLLAQKIIDYTFKK